MVFLVEQIESRKQKVLKFFTDAELANFRTEIVQNMKLQTSPQVVRAEKVVVTNGHMSPFQIDDQKYTSYSFIILPYCSKGTLIDLLLKAQDKNVYLSHDLALYLFK